MRTKTCKVCKVQFEPSRPMQTCCGPYCAVQIAQKRVMVRQKQKTRELKTKLKTRGQWLAEAQAEFNRYIRARDRNQPCISCGRHHQGQYHAGHYRTVKAAPELRFDSANVHKQCSACNTHLSGNIVEYRLNLLKKIGEQELERIEGPQTPVRLTVEDIRCLKAKFSKMARDEEAKNG